MSRTTSDGVVTRDGVRLAVDQLGSGRPVVLTHGWVVGGEMWEHVAALLASGGFRAVSVTRRGCGRSDHPADGYDLDTLADDLADVLDALALDDVTLVAHSVGGAEAVRLLSRTHGDGTGGGRVARLVLVATTTPGLLAAAPEAAEALVADLAADRPAYVRAGVPGFFGPDVPEHLAAWGVALTLRASLRASREVLLAGVATDTGPDLAACPVPALVVHGDADVSAPLDACGRASAAAVPGARLVVYPGGPHGLPLTHAGRLADDVVAFAGGPDGDGSPGRAGRTR